MKVLHIASFNGNIGDNANHNGFRNRLENIYDKVITYTKIEMREFYKSWRLRNFNSYKFISICNEHDLVVIGGGNFFELKWDYSSTGTTIDMKIDTLNRIKTPIFFNGIGCDIGKGASKSNIEKFKFFLDALLKKENCLISFREDGSKITLEKLFGKKYVEQFYFIPDNAFFMSLELDNNEFKLLSDKYIGMNIVSDMINVRFNNEKHYLNYLKELSNIIEKFLDEYPEYNLVLFPHIYSDLHAIDILLENISDFIRRTRVVVAPYLTGVGSDKIIFNMYRDCDVILGMRFHSNVCSIAQNIPTVALSSYPKIEFLYNNLDLVEQLVDVSKKNFGDILSKKLRDTIDYKNDIHQKYKRVNQELLSKRRDFEKKFENWLIESCSIGD